MELTHLFSPLETPRLKLKNRIIMLGTTLHYPQDGSVDDRTFEFLAARARGGAGLVMVGGIAVDKYAGTKGHLRIDDDAYIPSLTKLAEAIHQGGAKGVAQLFHAGRYAMLEDLQPRAPSAVAAAHYSHKQLPITAIIFPRK